MKFVIHQYLSKLISPFLEKHLSCHNVTDILNLTKTGKQQKKNLYLSTLGELYCSKFLMLIEVLKHKTVSISFVLFYLCILSKTCAHDKILIFGICIFGASYVQKADSKADVQYKISHKLTHRTTHLKWADVIVRIKIISRNLYTGK